MASRSRLRRLGRLELGLALDGQAAQAVDDEQDDLGIRLDGEVFGEFFPVHGGITIKEAAGAVNKVVLVAKGSISPHF